MFLKTLFGFYWSIIKKHPWYFTLVVLCGVYTTVVTRVFGPIISKYTVQMFESAHNGDTNKILWILGMFAILEFSILAFNWIDNYTRSHNSSVIMREVEISVLKRIYKNYTSFFVETMSGEIVSKGRVIIDGLFTVMRDPFIKLLGLFVGFLVIIGMLFQINIWFVVIILSVSAVRSGWRIIWQKKVNKLRKEQLQVNSKISGSKIDGLTNALTVQLFANEKNETDYLSKQKEKSIELERQRGFLDRVRWLPSSFVYMITYFVILIMSVYLISNDEMTLSNGVFTVGAFMSIGQIFMALSDLFLNLSEKRAEAEKAWSDLIIPVKIADQPNAHDLKITKPDLVFDNVTFAYKDKKILHNFCLTVSPKERVGLVGLSGAGKTTIVNLLLRMYDVQSGAIKISGHNIIDITKKSLRKNIAVVPQDVSLFNRTIFENITYAKPNAKKSDVIAAAKNAQIHDFIVGLPKGYDTLVGNRGVKLSGGQRQRIAIARAILKNAPILVMDEATSALDSASEAAIQRALNAVMKNKTVLVIAHRLSTLKTMDRIVVMDKGRLAQIGTHNQLLRQNGIYQKLWKIQKK